MQIAEKRQRLTGMITFSVLAIFLLWHVNFEDMEIVGFRTNPWGYGSLAYKLIDEFVHDDSYAHDSANFWWIATQTIPIVTSWGLRKILGKGVAFASTAAKWLYSRI